MAKPTNKSAARHEMVMGQLMEAAERLFAQQGVAGTSLQELAEAVGLTRTGIYHYIRNKDDMLEALVQGFTLETAEDMRSLAADESAPAIDRLREAVTRAALKVAQNPRRFRLLLTSENSFPEPLAKQYRQARRDTLTGLADLVSQAIKEGACRPVEPELAAFGLLGTANWTAFWYPRTEGPGSLSPEEVARTLTENAIAGLQASRTSSPEDNSVAHMIGLLEEDLGRLKRMVGPTAGQQPVR
jgi:AcrR family transcriptional regulator